MGFDTHAHYDSASFDSDRKEILQNMPAAGISLIVDPGSDAASSRAAVALAEEFPFVYAAVGWHPEEWESWDGESLATLRALARHPRVVAIGEIGLDYYWDKEHKERQKEMLLVQLQLAQELGLPVILHDREAHEDVQQAVSRFPGLRGVWHCYSGSAEMARQLVRGGWYLGFDGPVTYKNNRRAAEVLAVTPPERILLETDSPYLSPAPFRGQRNDSTHLPYIAARVAELKGMTAEEIEEITTQNGKRLFGIG